MKHFIMQYILRWPIIGVLIIYQLLIKIPIHRFFHPVYTPEAWIYRGVCLYAYINVIIYAWSYSITPLITLYGGWNFLGTILMITFLGFITSLLCFSITQRRTPMATPKENTNAKV